MPILVGIVLIWMLKRSRLASWWNPLNWWQDAGNAAGAIAGPLKSWVMGVIRDAVNLVERDVTDVLHWAEDAISFVLNFAHTVEQEAFTGIVDVFQWAGQEIYTVASREIRDIENVVNWVGRVGAGIVGYIGTEVGRILSWTVAEIGRVERDILSVATSIEQWALHIIQNVVLVVERWIQAALTTVGGWITHAIASLYSTLMRDIIGPIIVIINVVKRAFDWVVWFAEHPFTVIDAGERDIIGWLESQSTDAFDSAIPTEVARLESLLAKWLGT